MTHDELCKLAVKWLRRPNSAGGHGCSVAVSECRSGFGGEIPDAIGFRANWNNGSVVVEVKVSRSDFLADRNKPHRQQGGMGTWRYYMAPTGVLKPEDLPERWGLLEVGARRSITPVVGPAALSRNCGTFAQHLDDWRHEPDHDAERDLLTLLLARVGDPEKLNDMLKSSNNARAYLVREIEKLRQRNSELAARLWAQAK
jgi:hypothetical protein